MVMEEDGRTLSQQEIDAMLKAAAPAPKRAPAPQPEMAAPAAQPAPAAAPQAAPMVQAAPAVAPAANDAMLAALSQRLAAVEGMMARMAQLEAAVANLQMSGGGGPGAMEHQALMNQVRKLTAQVESLTKAARATPGFGARNSFTCASCGARGMVATVYRCTKCGKDKWLGFWPRR